MFQRLNVKTIMLRNKLSGQLSYNQLPYVHHLEHTLSLLDEILTAYELHDHAYTRKYRSFCRQWNAVERAYRKVLKQLLRTP